jgi:hypothetical protein
MITRTSRQRGFRGLGQYDSETGFVDPDPSINPSANNASLPMPAACSWWDDIWPSEACSLALGQQQIQSVPANAAAAGYPAPVVQATQAAADQQTVEFAADNAAIWHPPTNNPGSWPWYYWLAIGLGVFALVELGK